MAFANRSCSFCFCSSEAEADNEEEDDDEVVDDEDDTADALWMDGGNAASGATAGTATVAIGFTSIGMDDCDTDDDDNDDGGGGGVPLEEEDVDRKLEIA